MGTVYRPPKGFKAPDFSKYSGNIQEYIKAEDAYVKAIQRFIKQNYNHICPEAGKLVSFPVADGKALYVVVTLKPVALVHVDIGDAYTYQYVHRLTAKDIKNEIKQAEGLARLFRKKGKRSK